ncbi:hypothetical protein D3C77_807320 [compost metagenome]
MVLGLPERKWIILPIWLTSSETMVWVSEPSGNSLRKSARSEPVCGAPTLVAEAIRSGRMAAT